MAGQWRFLIDENLHPPIVEYLANQGIEGAYVPEILYEGADDDEEVLRLARTDDYVVVTNDVTDFSNRDRSEHEGIVLVYDGTFDSFEIATGLLNMVNTYPSRDELRGYEVLDRWL